MAMDFQLVESATFNSQFITLVVTVRSAIVATPGLTFEELAAVIGESESTTAVIVETMQVIGIAIVRTGIRAEVEVSVIWNAANFSDEVETNLSAANTWINNNPNGLLSDMQTALGVNYEIAQALGMAMERSAKIRRVRVL